MSILKKTFKVLLCAMMCFASMTMLEAEVEAINVAANKATVASSTYPTEKFSTTFAVDEDLGTRWGNNYNSDTFKGGNREETFTVDLGVAYTIDSVEIAWEAAHATSYTIQGSNDGETYVNLKDVTNGAGGTETHNAVSTEKYRYVRLAMHQSANKYGYSIYELRVYTYDQEAQPALGTIDNVAYGKDVYVSAGTVGEPSLIVDGDTRYEYTAKTNVIPFLDVKFIGDETPQDEDGYYYHEPAYVIVDLGASYVIDSLKIFDFDNTTQVARDYTYSVALSNDENFSVANYNDANWIEVGRTPKGARTCVTDFDLSEKVVARYVKLYDLRVLEATSFAVTEVQVFATKGDVANAKAYANNELDAYKADVPLTEEEANAKASVVANAKTSFEAASDASAIIAALNQAMKDIDTVISASEYKNEKIDEITNYKSDDSLFSEADNVAQASKLVEAIEQIKAATDCAVMDQIVADYIAFVDQFDIIANLALNKKAVASSQEANSVRPVLAFDGDTTGHESRWGSAKGNGPHWLYVDLGEVQDVRTVVVYWENRKPTSYSIQISNDASKWETVEAFTTRPQRLNESIIFDEVKQARYVRLYVETFTKEDPDGGIEYNTVSLYEVEVYGVIHQLPESNIARGKTAYASSEEASTVRKELGVDGDHSSADSRWGSAKGNGPHWFYVDLGDQVDIRTIKVFWETRKATKYAVQVSDDAITWEDVKVSESRPKALVERIVLDETIQKRYVRLYVEKFTAEDPDGGIEWNSISIYELEVFGGEPKPTGEELLGEIIVFEPTLEDTKLKVEIPKFGEGTKAFYNGTDYEHIVDRDLTIYHPLVDTEVKVSFKYENELNGEYSFAEKTVVIPGTYAHEEGDNAAPTVLPELTEWKGHTGTFSIADTSKIVIGDASLNDVATEFANDYKDLLGKEIQVEVGTKDDVNAGDFFFALTTDLSKGLKKEGYLMSIEDAIYVEAEQLTGAYWSTRTILQALKASGNNTIAKGITRDYPLYEVRSIVLDVGRIPFTMDYLKQVVKQMAWYKMNDFHVHLNDNYIWLESHSDPMNAYSGFRLESDIKQGGTVLLGDEQKEFTYQADLTSKDVFYTKAEFRDFINDSRVMGVNIVPEFDTPAHSLALTKVLPELRTGTSGRDNDHLDLSKQYDECLDFVTNIFDEYLLGEDPVFDEETIVHIGCDEYTANPNAFRHFTNDLADYVKSNNRQPRVWGALSKLKGDGSVPVDGTGVQINLWDTGWSDMKEMYDLGFDLISCNDNDYYIVPNCGYYNDYLSESKVYDLAVNQIGSNFVPAGDKQMIGGAFAIWNDMTDVRLNGISEYDVYVRMNKALPLFAAKLRGKQDKTLAQAKEAAATLGDAPNTNFAYELEDVSEEDYEVKELNETEFVVDEEVTALELKGGNSFATTGLTTAGLNNTLKVKVMRTSESTDEQILLESAYGTIKAVQKDTGKVGISRELFDYSFNYTLPVGQWVELEFRNQFEQISLYVNGTKVDTLGDGDKAGNNRPMKATCMFPLAKIGSETSAFVGKVASVKLNDQEILNYTADYSAVDTAITAANALDASQYEDFSGVEAAINAVVRDKDIREQASVDAMAQAILDAIDALVEKTSTKVENLVANVVDYKTISLTWDAYPNAQTYTVERLTAEGDWIEIATTTEPTYVAAGVKTGKEYTYRVKADNAEYSDEVSVTPMLSGEVELSIAMNGTNKFDLSWTGVEGATRYIIYRKASNGEWKKVLTLGKDARTYTSKEMLPDTYTYQVKAARYDSVDRVMTAGSNLVEATASVEAEAFTLQVSKESDTTVALSWNKVAGMKYYEVYRCDASGTYRLLKRTTATSTTNTVKVGKTYTYKLRAYNLVGDTKVYSAYSNEVSYTAQ